MTAESRLEELQRLSMDKHRKSSLGICQSPISDAVKHEGSVDFRSDDVVDNLSRILRRQFAIETRDIAKTKTHQKVAVLLLSWLKVSDAHMDVSEEVDDLEKVFVEKYGFKVYKKVFIPGTQPHYQVISHLSTFLGDEDHKDTLLLIYYAGHGMPDHESEKLTLLGGNPTPGEEHLTQFVWNKAEGLLHDISADLLLIFDCCHAGILARQNRARRDKPSIFEFIGSTQADKTAVGPGDDSFTRALIYALKELADTKEGFTTTQLFDKIKDAPYFRDIGQKPVTSERSKIPSYKRLKILPLNSANKGMERVAVNTYEHPEDIVCCYLRLNFRFTRLPEEADITSLTQGLCQLAKKDFPIEQVEWEGLTKSAPLTFAEIVAAKNAVTRMRKRRSRASIDLGSAVDQDELDNVVELPSSPAEEVLNLSTFEQESLMLMESMESKIEHIEQSTTTTLDSILHFRSQRKVLVAGSVLIACALMSPRCRNLVKALFV